jgi:hypothetical protein
MIPKEAKKTARAHVASAVLLSIMLVSMVCVIGSAPLASGSPAANESLSEKETDPNSYAVSLHNKLISAFFTTLPNGTKVLIYPVEYAGAYIDNSNNLHIVLSKYATNTTISNYRDIMGNDPDIIFEAAEFPLSRLYEFQDALVGATFSFDKACVAVKTNRLEINLPDGTKQQAVIEFFRTRFSDFDDSCITFLGPCPITAGIGDVNSPTMPPESNDGFLETDMPTTYVVAVVAIFMVTIALGACYLVFVRHRTKQQHF